MIYELRLNKGKVIYVDDPYKLQEMGGVAEMREPIVEANILVPQ